MDCSLPDSSVHWIFQARIVEWVAMPSSREIFPTPVVELTSFVFPALAGRFFTTAPPGKPYSLQLFKYMYIATKHRESVPKLRVPRVASKFIIQTMPCLRVIGVAINNHDRTTVLNRNYFQTNLEICSACSYVTFVHQHNQLKVTEWLLCSLLCSDYTVNPPGNQLPPLTPGGIPVLQDSSRTKALSSLALRAWSKLVPLCWI